MSIYRIADLNIKINNTHQYTTALCRKYINADFDQWDIAAEANKDDYEADLQIVPNATEGYLESLSIYRSIANQILDFNGFVLHASVVEKDGCAYAFSAKSGTGKTTHSRIWTERFPDARIINGDKPLVRFIDGKLYIYGTPWCGKENYQVNTRAPLKAVCFIERSDTNSIEPINKADAVSRIFHQLLIPKDPVKLNKLLDLVDGFIDVVPAYLLKCNMEQEAAEVAYQVMSK